MAKLTYEEAVANRINHGWRIVSETRTDTLMAKGERINHLVHILLTVISVGIWGIYYGLRLIFGGLKQVRITKDSKGNARVKQVFN